jgi:hypothetical protein
MAIAKRFSRPSAPVGRLACLLFTLAIPLLIGCEVDMTLSIDGKNPPTFTLDGSGNLAFFMVREIVPENQVLPRNDRISDKNILLWKIWPEGPARVRISKLPPITYGRIPENFEQTLPVQGTPPTLEEGKIYEAGGPASSANGGTIWFTIKDGKSVIVQD